MNAGTLEMGTFKAGTLEAARLRHPAGSRLAGRSAAPAQPALRLVPAPVAPVVQLARITDASVGGARVIHMPIGGRRTRRPGARLTRRGRGVLFGVFLALMFVAGLASGAHAVGADSRSAVPVVRHTMVVQPGQTLWQIARAVDPAADTRDTVQRIVDANALPGVDIEAGRTLVLP